MCTLSYDEDMTYHLSFYRWLKHQQNRDDIVGDLAKDLYRDKVFSALPIKSINAVRLYIREKTTHTAIHNALEQAWTEFKEYRKS